MKNLFTKAFMAIACAMVLATASTSAIAGSCCCTRYTPYFNGVKGHYFYTYSSCCAKRYLVKKVRCSCCGI